MKINEIHVFLRGGLGNQLFQYALGLHVSITQDKRLVIREDLLPESEDEIGGVSRWPNQIAHFEHSGRSWSRSHQPAGTSNSFGKFMQAQRMLGDLAPGVLRKVGIYGAEASGLMDGNFPVRGLKVLNGYASSKEFALAEKQILTNQVHNLRDPSIEFEKLDAEIRSISPIVVHLRMGDYLSLTDIYGSISIQFVKQAIASLSDSVRPPIWIFTQTRQELGQDFLETIRPERVIDSKTIRSPLENLLLMSHGGGLICSNSTLSWWGAFLSGNAGNIVAPRYTGKTNVFTREMSLHFWRVLTVDQ